MVDQYPMGKRSRVAMWMAALIIATIAGLAGITGAYAESSVRPPSNAVTVQGGEPTEGNVPGDVLGNTSRARIWGEVRHGAEGGVTIPDPYAATLIQSQGQDWRLVHNDLLVINAARLLVGVLVVLAVFFAIRGRIKIKGGRSGRVMPRFSLVERIVHWFTATLFVLLAVSGLILLFGKAALIPLIGASGFGLVASAAMQGHNLFGPLFILAILALFLVFVRGNGYRLVDFMWALKGGGLLGGHASSGRYNFGEKSWFWWAVIGGVAISLTGGMMLFPDHSAALMARFYPDEVAGRSLMQLANLIHAAAAILFIAFAFGHIYLGTIGMEGALEGMTRGVVDENWAKEHHDIWYDEHAAAVGTDEVKAEIEAAAGNV